MTKVFVYKTVEARSAALKKYRQWRTKYDVIYNATNEAWQRNSAAFQTCSWFVRREAMTFQGLADKSNGVWNAVLEASLKAMVDAMPELPDTSEYETQS